MSPQSGCRPDAALTRSPPPANPAAHELFYLREYIGCFSCASAILGSTVTSWHPPSTGASDAPVEGCTRIGDHLCMMRESNLMCTGADMRIKSLYGNSLKHPSAHLNVGEAQPGVQTEVGRAARHVQLCDRVRLARPIVLGDSKNRLLQGLPSRRRGAAAASCFQSVTSCCRAGRRCGASCCYRRRGAAHTGRHPAGGGLERRQLRVARVRQPHHRQAVPHLPRGATTS